MAPLRAPQAAICLVRIWGKIQFGLEKGTDWVKTFAEDWSRQYRGDYGCCNSDHMMMEEGNDSEIYSYY